MKVTKEEVLQASLSTKSATEAARKLGIKIDTYRKYALQLGCYYTNPAGKGVKKTRKNVKFDEHFFDVIDSVETAYFLGYIAADGSVSNNTLSFNIARKDRCILEYFCKCLNINSDCVHDYVSHYTDDDGMVHYFDASYCNFTSEHMVNRLKCYNIIPKKTYSGLNLFYGVPDCFCMAWICGLLDGDGCIVFSGRKSHVSFSGNYLTLVSIRRYLSIKFGFGKGCLSKVTDVNYDLSYRSKTDVLLFLSLYIGGSTFHLPRKYNLAFELLHTYSCFASFGLMDKERVVVGCTDVNFVEENDFVFSKGNVCCDCGKLISNSAVRCKSCAAVLKNSSVRPDRERLKSLLQQYCNFLEIGRLFGVTDNAVRKWCKFYGLPFRTSELRALSLDDWRNL